MVRANTWVALGLLATTAAIGCAAGTSNTGGGGSSSDSTSSATGAAATTSSSSHTGGTGTGGTATGGTSTGGTATGGTSTGGTGGSTGCGATEKPCNGTCVAIDDPAYGCGTTGCTPCDSTHAAVACANGACTITGCASGWDDCNHSATDGCETELSTPFNCGSCGNACTLPDQCHTLGACNPSTKTCAEAPKANGTACNDGNACTTGDTCQSGICGGAPVTCAALDQCHVAGTCDLTTGACSNPPKANGAACDDGNPCTTGDACQSGTCGGAPVTCAALDQCHVAGTCDPTTGACSNPPKANGAACDDGNACTTGDTCQSGTCGGAPVTCAALDQCHVAGTCDPTTGACSNPPKANGSACDDGNACTSGDTCQSGACQSGTPKTCAALDPCHVAGTCDPTTGACSNPSATDGTACDDGNACTSADHCTGGVCGGTACPGACGTSLVAFTGSPTTGWNFNGSAKYDSTSNTAVLADGTVTTGQAGTVIYKNAIAADAFTVLFDFKMTASGAYSRADGIAFVIETDGATSVGSGYGGFGVLGLHGYGVELDVFDSGPCELQGAPPGTTNNGNHAGVDLLSACSGNAGILSPIATSGDLYTPVDAGDNGIGDIGDGQWRTAMIQLAGGKLSVSITDPSTSSFVAVPNLQGVSLPGFTSGTAYYFGFGGGSGSNHLAAREEIRNVQVSFPSTRCL